MTQLINSASGRKRFQRSLNSRAVIFNEKVFTIGEIKGLIESFNLCQSHPDSLTNPILITAFLPFQPKGHHKPHKLT